MAEGKEGLGAPSPHTLDWGTDLAPNTHSQGLCYRSGQNLLQPTWAHKGTHTQRQRDMLIYPQAHTVMRADTYVQAHTKLHTHETEGL